MFTRELWPELENVLDRDEAIVITGPRQVGKSTTLEHLLNKIPGNKLSFDLTNILDRQFFETENFENIIAKIKTKGVDISKRICIGIDEIQFLPQLPLIVKYLIDHYKIKFILTGSSSYYLKNKFTESLAGRKFLYELLPLSFREFLLFKGVKNIPEKFELFNCVNPEIDDYTYNQFGIYYEEYIKFGGFPKVVLEDNTDIKNQILFNIFDSYVNTDIETLSDFKSAKDIRTLIKVLAPRIGNRVNIQELSSVIGLSREKIESYLTFLEQTYLIKQIEAYSKSSDIKTKKPKKLYFIDTGIAKINGDLSGGAKFENTLCHQLSFYGDVNYWEKSKVGEIDFIIKDKQKQIALEAKESPTLFHKNSLSKFSNKIGVNKSNVIGRYQSAKFKNYIWGGLL